MEDVNLSQPLRPTGSVVVDKTVQEANFYAEPSSTRPVESTEIFFKDYLGTLSCAPGDARGTLLLSIDLNFNHGPNLESRKLNYAYIKYKELKISGKRTDIVFGRSGSVGIVYTTNPWYKVSTTDPAANALAVASDPTYRILTISDKLEIDILRNIKDMTKANDWYHVNQGDGMPLDYYMAGHVYIFVESPPQLLPYELPVYTAGTVLVRDFIPSALASLTFVKHRIDGDVQAPHLVWDPKRSEYIVRCTVASDVNIFNTAEFIPDEPMNATCTVKELPADGDDTDQIPTEVHTLYDSPAHVVFDDDFTFLEFRTTVSKLTNFMQPVLEEISFDHARGWGVIQSVPSTRRVKDNIHVDSIPEGSPSLDLPAFRRLIGMERVNAGKRFKAGLAPLMSVRPAGEPDVLNLAKMHVGASS